MDYDRIIGLLDKYWKCETTLPEEEELRYFYKHCRQMPEELAEYRELFIFQEGERQIGLGNDFDRKILASIYNKRPAGWRKGLRVAAVLLLLIGVSQVLIDIGNPQKDTCQTPEQALAEVRQPARKRKVPIPAGNRKISVHVRFGSTPGARFFVLGKLPF